MQLCPICSLIGSILIAFGFCTVITQKTPLLQKTKCKDTRKFNKNIHTHSLEQVQMLNTQAQSFQAQIEILLSPTAYKTTTTILNKETHISINGAI